MLYLMKLRKELPQKITGATNRRIIDLNLGSGEIAGQIEK
jgi:hypothetical protein